MKRTYTTIMIILVLAGGIAAMFFLFNRPAAALPKMPIYNPSKSENAADINTSADEATLCKNIFFPLAVGVEWRYQTKLLSRSDTLKPSVL